MRWVRRPSNDARRLTLHVGTPKSGTTFLQARLRAARTALARGGVLYPGGGYLPKGGLNQQAATYGLAGPEVAWITEQVRVNGRRLLVRVRRETDRQRGHTLVSAEALSSFGTERVPAAIAGLGYEPDQVDVVITARDLGRLLTSVWQENVKNGATAEMDDYLASVARLRGEPDSSFWTAYRLPELVDRWARVVGHERITLVTSPSGSDPEVLWSRYLDACGLTEVLARDDAPPPPESTAESNRSLTLSQTELLRHVNVILERDGIDIEERQLLRRNLLRAWMDGAPAGGRSLGLDGEWLLTLRCWALDDIAALRDHQDRGMRLVGRLDDLQPRPRVISQGARHEPRTDEAARDLLALLRQVDRAGSGSRRRGGWNQQDVWLLAGLVQAGLLLSDSGQLLTDLVGSWAA